MAEARYRGEVVKLDRGYPLVRLEDGELLRCEHATALVKGERRRAVIGDVVEVAVPPAHDKGVIEAIAPRTREFVRKDPTERAVPQVLAANFERVIVAQPVGEVNLRRLERELVLAFETGAEVTVVLTKADLADDAATRATVEAVQALAAPAADVLVVSEDDPASVEAVRALIGDYLLRIKGYKIAQLNEVVRCESMCPNCLITENCSLRDERVDQELREAGEIE